jgi:hypothetical protein
MVVIHMWKRILSWFGKRNAPKMNSSGVMENLLNKLAITEEQEISCDDVHELLDQFIEMEMRGEDVAKLMPLVQKHLDLCPDCREEHEALLLALEFEKRMKE